MADRRLKAEELPDSKGRTPHESAGERGHIPARRKVQQKKYRPQGQG